MPHGLIFSLPKTNNIELAEQGSLNTKTHCHSLKYHLNICKKVFQRIFLKEATAHLNWQSHFGRWKVDAWIVIDIAVHTRQKRSFRGSAARKIFTSQHYRVCWESEDPIISDDSKGIGWKYLWCSSPQASSLSHIARWPHLLYIYFNKTEVYVSFHITRFKEILSEVTSQLTKLDLNLLTSEVLQ